MPLFPHGRRTRRQCTWHTCIILLAVTGLLGLCAVVCTPLIATVVRRTEREFPRYICSWVCNVIGNTPDISNFVTKLTQMDGSLSSSILILGKNIVVGYPTMNEHPESSGLGSLNPFNRNICGDVSITLGGDLELSRRNDDFIRIGEIIGNSVRTWKSLPVPNTFPIQGWRNARVLPRHNQRQSRNLSPSNPLYISDLPVKRNQSTLHRFYVLAIYLIGIKHSLKLIGINKCDPNPYPEDEQFNYQLPINSFPPWRRWMLPMIGMALFGWGRWILGFRKSDFTERTAVFALITMFGGVILALWSVWLIH